MKKLESVKAFTQVCYLKAVRVTDFDMVGDKDYGDRPYGVCLDVYDSEGNFVESGTDWSYFATEQDADKFVKVYNKLKAQHEAIRNILIDYNCVEYGDCIIDEICEVVGLLPTTIYSEEKGGV